MLKPHSKVFAATSEALHKGYTGGMKKLTHYDIDSVAVVREWIMRQIHEITGSRKGHKVDAMCNALEHIHPGKGYEDLEMIVKDLAEIGLTLTRLSQKRNRTNPDRSVEAKVFCDYLKRA